MKRHIEEADPPGNPVCVSIIIPFYNHDRYIEECLNSIKGLTGIQFEVCIVDDGSSTDQTVNLERWIQENEHEVAVVYRKQRNEGVTRTLNKLIRMSKGDYIFVMASDDYLLPGVEFARVFEFMTENSALMCVCDCAVVDQDSTVLQPSNAQTNGFDDLESFNADPLKVILRHWFFAGAICIYDRQLFEQIGGFDESLIVEDWDFFIRAANSDSLVFMNYAISAYRLHGGNTHSNVERRKLLFDSLLRTCVKNFREFGLSDKVYVAILIAIYFAKSKTGYHFKKGER